MPILTKESRNCFLIEDKIQTSIIIKEKEELNNVKGANYPRK